MTTEGDALELTVVSTPRSHAEIPLTASAAAATADHR
ncbi:hypothetical protein SCNU_11061 [Gordonia neofelifaecis NRRL B-59395]|uniref:Uncharacterized protein n=1 Tax=Gordonia neofelifaecis NRRL B-59395 TaxID=644548 RepID=F1YJY2_9ACTN|nr:hypothetical protein SCNU_11061 [Gordonia neofelifaecis NRRL B-59395]